VEYTQDFTLIATHTISTIC